MLLFLLPLELMAIVAYLWLIYANSVTFQLLELISIIFGVFATLTAGHILFITANNKNELGQLKQYKYLIIVYIIIAIVIEFQFFFKPFIKFMQ